MNLLMNRNTLKVVLLAVVAVGGWIGLSVLEGRWSQNAMFKELQEERDKRIAAEAKAEQLKGVVKHLQSEQRVADILVTDATPSLDGQLYTTLLFQEYAKDGSALPPKRFTIRGNEAHIDALVVKFQGKFVEDRDPLRGRSVALFTKLFDDKQAPEQGHLIDDPDHIPAVYRGADPKVDDFEKQLWKDFWKLAQDKTYRDQMGVDVMQGKSVWWKFEPGFRYTITLQADADMNLRYEPVPAVYKEMLRQNSQSRPSTVPVD